MAKHTISAEAKYDLSALKSRSRRDGLSNEEISGIFRELRDDSTSPLRGLDLSIALKYAIRKAGHVSFEDLLSTQSNKHDTVKEQILIALAYKLQHSTESIGDAVAGKIREYAGNVTGGKDAKDRLHAELKKKFNTADDQAYHDTHGKIKFAAGHVSSAGPKAVVTKNQQTVRAQKKNLRSEEESVKILAFEALLCGKKKKVNATPEPKKPTASSSGTDRS